MPAPDPWIALAILAVAGAAWLREHLQPDADPVEAAKRRYERGEIDEAQLERELAYHLDDEAQRLEARLQSVPGVGAVTAEQIARRFGSVEAVRAADVDDLTDVHGVGESTADAILRAFGA